MGVAVESPVSMVDALWNHGVSIMARIASAEDLRRILPEP
jgi:hypothetical protein